MIYKISRKKLKFSRVDKTHGGDSTMSVANMVNMDYESEEAVKNFAGKHD